MSTARARSRAQPVARPKRLTPAARAAAPTKVADVTIVGKGKAVIIEAKTTRTPVMKSLSTGVWRAVYEADRLDRVAAIQDGVPASDFYALVAHMGRTVGTVGRSLGVANSTLRRKAKVDEKLSPADSERVIGLASLIGQVDRMLGNDRPADFDAAKWVANWVEQPHPALGGRRPEELFDTTTGQSLVSDLLASTASGAYW